MEQWKLFFTEADIPVLETQTYVKTFVDNRIIQKALSDLSREYVADLGFSVIGNILGIIRHCKAIIYSEILQTHFRPNFVIFICRFLSSLYAVFHTLSVNQIYNQLMSKTSSFVVSTMNYYRLTFSPRPEIQHHLKTQPNIQPIPPSKSGQKCNQNILPTLGKTMSPKNTTTLPKFVDKLPKSQ